jgi:hypothetical protein
VSADKANIDEENTEVLKDAKDYFTSNHKESLGED